MHDIVIDNFTVVEPKPVQLRCPFCKSLGTFTVIGTDDLRQGPHDLGNRKCPNPECGRHVFVVIRETRTEYRVERVYPAQGVELKASNMPGQVTAALTEAVTCRGQGCLRAAAIMIRRTLELVCEDKKAQGKSLEERIESLRTKVTLPNELFEGMHGLRLLGNDAAHVKAKTYDSIGADELRISLRLVSELLNALYEYAELVKELNALKKKSQPQT